MKAMAGCALFGAVKALSGIKDAFVLQHSVIGCNYGTLNYRNVHKNYDVRQASTVVYNNEVIYGGQELLVKGIKEIDKRFPELKTIFVVSGCVPNMIGDDVEMVLEETGSPKQLIHIKAPGYSGNFDSGVEVALLSLSKMVEEQPKTERPSINIIGLSADDPYAEQDIQELKRLLGNKVEVNCCLADTTTEAVSHMSAAHLNVVFGYGTKLAQKLERSFGTPYVECNYPYGIQGMIEFLQQLGEALKVDFAPECAEIFEAGKQIVRKTAYYLNAFYQQPVALVGDKLHRSGLKTFLEEELGMEVVISMDVAVSDERELEKKLKADRAALLLGTGLQRELSRKLEIPFVGYCYPLQDQLCLTVGHVGAMGTAHLLEQLINSVLQQSYKEKGIYHQLIEARGEEQ